MSEMQRIRQRPERIDRKTRPVGHAPWQPKGSTTPLPDEAGA